MQLRLAVMMSINERFRADKMEATFNYEIKQRAPDMFEKVLKQFEIEDEIEPSIDIASESATIHG